MATQAQREQAAKDMWYGFEHSHGKAMADWPWELAILHRLARNARVLLRETRELQDRFREVHERGTRRDMGLTPEARLVLIRHARIVSWLENANREMEALGIMSAGNADAPCRQCDGRGQVGDAIGGHAEPCDACGGSGEVWK